MASFRRPERTTTIVFDEGEFAGAEVEVVTNPAWRVYRDVMLFTEADDEPAPETAAAPEDAEVQDAPGDLSAEMIALQRARDRDIRIRNQTEKLDGLIGLLADDVVRGWNVVDHNDEPIPATAEGLARMPAEFIGELLAYWFLHIGKPAPPLAIGSSAGEPTERP